MVCKHEPSETKQVFLYVLVILRPHACISSGPDSSPLDDLRMVMNGGVSILPSTFTDQLVYEWSMAVYGGLQCSIHRPLHPSTWRSRELWLIGHRQTRKLGAWGEGICNMCFIYLFNECIYIYINLDGSYKNHDFDCANKRTASCLNNQQQATTRARKAPRSALLVQASPEISFPASGPLWASTPLKSVL